MIIGIDLGTTFSLAAAICDGEPTVLRNALGQYLTPSAVHYSQSGEIVVGAAALARLTLEPERTVTAFKRDMGTDKVFTLGDKTFTPVELSALVLRQIKEDAEASLGIEITEAVVTVPAYFGQRQRQATRDAGAVAGLTVERIINEPTAAALAYGLRNRGAELSAIVLDLGGGTFDVSVLEIMEGVVEIQGSAGDARLGGEDFTDALAGWAAAAIQAEHKQDPRTIPHALARLRSAADHAKRQLSSRDQAHIALPRLFAKPSVDVDLSLTRTDAEQIWQETLARMRAPIARAMRDAETTAGEIEAVLLVGGASRMPCVVSLAAQLFGQMPLRHLPPDEAIALGAAIQAGLKAGDEAVNDLVVTDVAPFTLGLKTQAGVGAHALADMFSPIIERGTVIPTSRSESFHASNPGQNMVRIQVYQGEHARCSQNTLLGEYEVPLPGTPDEQAHFEVRFSYDINGLLEVDTTVSGETDANTLVIEREPGRMSPNEIKAARDQLARLKFHPRDTLPNATAMSKAEALYQELNGDSRRIVGELIAAFHQALESQDDDMINRLREEIFRMTNQHESL